MDVCTRYLTCDSSALLDIFISRLALFCIFSCCSIHHRIHYVLIRNDLHGFLDSFLVFALEFLFSFGSGIIVMDPSLAPTRRSVKILRHVVIARSVD